MKKVALILSIILLVSCNTDDDAGDIINSEFEQIKIILPQGEWKVNKLYEDQADHTAAFESFVFTFKEDGTVEGQTDLYTEVGTWEYKSTSESGEQLILQFNGTTPFDKISDDWDIISLGISKIELSNVNENNGGTKLLTFSKL